MIGDVAIIDGAFEMLKNKVLILKIMEGLQNNISSEIKFSNNKKHVWLGQPHLIKNLENKLGWLINEFWSHKTPGNPKFLIVRPTKENEKILIEDQGDNRSGIGILLCLVKYS